MRTNTLGNYTTNGAKSKICLAFKYKFHKDRIGEAEIKNIVEKVLHEVYGAQLTIEPANQGSKRKISVKNGFKLGLDVAIEIRIRQFQLIRDVVRHLACRLQRQGMLCDAFRVIDHQGCDHATLLDTFQCRRRELRLHFATHACHLPS